jgi:hypothetical protein
LTQLSREASMRSGHVNLSRDPSSRFAKFPGIYKQINSTTWKHCLLHGFCFFMGPSVVRVFDKYDAHSTDWKRPQLNRLLHWSSNQRYRLTYISCRRVTSLYGLSLDQTPSSVSLSPFGRLFSWFSDWLMES